MEAQNAAESDPPKHAGASPQQQEKQHDRPRQGSGSSSGSGSGLGQRRHSSSSLRPSSPSRDAKAKTNRPPPAATATAAAAATAASSSSSTLPRADDAPATVDRDSDAETIVLPGKDGHSPSKARKVRQEDRSESDGDAVKGNGHATSSAYHAEKIAAGSRPGEAVKKKRPLPPGDKDRQPRTKDGASSGLSSAPASPPHHQNQQNRHQQHQQAHRRRSDAAAAASLSDSEGSHHKPSSSSLRDKLKSGERLLPHKRKAPKADSDDEAEQRKARRQRTTSVTLDNGRAPKDFKSASSKPQQLDSRTRSISPHQRQHRRSISTQLPSQTSGSFKKKRLPPPLQSTEYHSDESSASGSPHPRNAKLRSLATSATSESHPSPVKMAPHKKHLDAHGQTFLARACARGEYESVKRRLSDRPEDLNVADYAGNTPLQIAAINGCEDIVKLLIDAGCNLDCVNYDKDTPLLDAVDNGHVGVVRLLLDAGVNPRKANVNGEEPIDRVNEDTENGDEIRALLLAAKKRQGGRRRTSEDRHSHVDYHDTRDSHAPDSPRHSPAATLPGTMGRRGGTSRATKTRNDLLYMPLDDKTLRQAAGRGDEETVARILQVKEGLDDPESMVAAARGGHDLVIQLLLGLGGANADPGPVPTLPAEFATPILAAIGQENIKVIELLLEQQNFDPTRRFKGETYYEIAHRRQGTNWKEEEHMLKNAYDEYKRTHRDITKIKSPGRRERERGREREKEERRSRRDEAKEDPRPHKRNTSSPAREGEVRKKAPASSAKLSSPKEKRRADSFTSHGDDHSQRRGLARPKKEDRTSNLSDREVSPTPSHKPPKAKRAESDVTGISSEGETVKPRRKLVSKGELKGERERQKRGSIASNSSGMKEPSSPNESRNEESSDRHKLSEKYHDRTKALKRDESRDRVSVSGDGPAKRHRTSVTPDRPSDGDKDNADAPVKRRRLEGESQERRPQKQTTSVEGKPRKPSSTRDGSSKPSTTLPRKSREEESKGHQDERDVHRKDSGRSISGEKLVRVKSEDDTDMADADRLNEIPESHDRKARENGEEQARKRELVEREEAKKEEERRRARAEEKRKREQEEARQREEEERKRKEQEEREKQRKREEEEARKRREQAERERREAEEAARRQEEEKRRLEEEKRKREEEEKRKREEEERKRREEEQERLRKEQLEREAAEEARRQREEEERKERERRERAHREEMERKRAAAAREAEEKRRLQEEQERARLDKLPPLLRWLSVAPNPKTSAVAEKFKNMHGARYDTIRPEANNTSEGREQWVLNTHVALLLGERDLGLSRYSSWERVPASYLAKLTIWRTEWTRYSLVSEKLWDLGRQIPGYYGDEDPSTMNFYTKERLKKAAWEKFLNTDMFFVKVSDFMYTIPNIPHLRSIKLGVEYCELIESEAQATRWVSSQKWKQDPDADRYHGFAPRFKYYVDGVMVGEEMPTRCQTSKTPFPETRVPRRGLVRVYPDDPDYTRICLEQGLEHLIKGNQSSPPPLANGVVHSSSPARQRSATPARAAVNGMNGHSTTDPAHDDTTMTNGEMQTNGVNGSSSQDCLESSAGRV